jgi:hypothetical protein
MLDSHPFQPGRIKRHAQRVSNVGCRHGGAQLPGQDIAREVIEHTVDRLRADSVVGSFWIWRISLTVTSCTFFVATGRIGPAVIRLTAVKRSKHRLRPPTSPPTPPQPHEKRQEGPCAWALLPP